MHVATGGAAVAPAASGTRHWTYVVDNGEPLNRTTWLRRCCALAVVRRFSEPEIALCPDCSPRRVSDASPDDP